PALRIVAHYLLSTAMPTRYISTLSLHDALPIFPDSAHGTNPASAHLSGFKVKTIRSTLEGLTDLDHLRELCGHGDVAGLMLTNQDRKSTRLNSSHEWISYAVFCLKKKI